jgi:hypothetical protein
MDETETVCAEIEQHFHNHSTAVVEQVLAHLVAKLIVGVGNSNQERARLLTVFCKDVARCAQHQKEPTLQ